MHASGRVCVRIGKIRKKEIRKFGYANPIAGWPSEVLPTLSVPDRVRYARASRHCKSYYDQGVHIYSSRGRAVWAACNTQRVTRYT